MTIKKNLINLNERVIELWRESLRHPNVWLNQGRVSKILSN